MRIATIIFIFAFVLPISSKSQNKPITGFLFLSVDFNYDYTFDFFVATQIDTTKSLEENLKTLDSDTLRRIVTRNMPPESVAQSINVMVGGHHTTFQVVPVEVKMGDWIMYDMFLHRAC